MTSSYFDEPKIPTSQNKSYLTSALSYIHTMKLAAALLLVLIYTTCAAQNSKDSHQKPSVEPAYPDENQKNRKATNRQRRGYLRIASNRQFDFGRSGFNLALIGGIWIPTGQLTPLGIHPELGFQLGSKKDKSEFDFTMVFKFLNTPNYYYAKRNGTPELTNHFFGGYIGLDYRRDVYRKDKHEVSLLAGGGLDGFDVFNYNNTKTKTASILTYNLNIGVGYRFYYKNMSYIGVNVNYNFVDYTVNNVVDFTGNPVTIRLVFGNVSADRLKPKL
ncbi:hypothetical protein BH10BAC4_BH10BAC4_08030 [soil metagenome]